MQPVFPPWRPVLDQPSGDADLTWAYPWPGGERLAADLPALGPWNGLRIAELGCGRGRCGLTLLLLGAESCLFCDGSPEPLAYVTSALAHNHLAERGCTAQHSWGAMVPNGPYDVLIGADILYRPAYHVALLTSLAGALAPQGRALLSDPRAELEPDLRDQAQSVGLSWHEERRPGEYTLVTLRHLH
jgi:predicted nicotinamide N-methyase